MTPDGRRLLPRPGRRACSLPGEPTGVLHGSGRPLGWGGEDWLPAQRKHWGASAPWPDRNRVTATPRHRQGAFRHVAQWGIRPGVLPACPLVLPCQPRGFRADSLHRRRCGLWEGPLHYVSASARTAAPSTTNAPTVVCTPCSSWTRRHP